MSVAVTAPYHAKVSKGQTPDLSTFDKAVANCFPIASLASNTAHGNRQHVA